MTALTSVNLDLLPQSLAATGDVEFGLARTPAGVRLAVMAPPATPWLRTLDGQAQEASGRTLVVGPLSAANAAALRARTSWLAPVLLDLRASVGLGDRLGLATPGHIRALRSAGTGIAAVLAQQSVRENQRTGRTPQQVLDAAVWGAVAEGWREGFGADADHLKTPAEIGPFLQAGYTFFTIDPGERVEGAVDSMRPADVQVAFDTLPWDRLEDAPEALVRRYVGRPLDLEGFAVTFDEETIVKAAVKYGRAVAHVALMCRHLAQAAGERPFEVEVSVDETDTPTSHGEHVYVATELKRLGVRFVSLAPRFVGRFEKGVDFIGDLDEFERHVAGHAAIARALGPYKLSLHSGSDKFSVYGAVARHTRGLVHVKTAGTSYLEALRTVAGVDAPFFRKLYAFAREHYEADRASYHVSARLDRAPHPGVLTDGELAGVLDQFDARQILHVTFGTILTARSRNGRLRFGERLIQVLEEHAESYAANLERHLGRHLAPFAAAGQTSCEALA